MHQDFLDLLQLLNDFQVEYLVVGGYAVGVHAEVRATKDIDIWVNPTEENAKKVFNALVKFGAPLSGLDYTVFKDIESFYKMGLEPFRVDLLMSLPSINFEDSWKRKKTIFNGNYQIHFIGIEDLIANKKSVGRPQDLADVAKLTKVLKKIR